MGGSLDSFKNKATGFPWGVFIAQMSYSCRPGEAREPFVGKASQDSQPTFPRSEKSELFTLTRLRQTLWGNVVQLTEE